MRQFTVKPPQELPEPMERRQVGVFERHVQTLLLSLATAALLASSAFMWRAQETFARVDERVTTIARDLGKVSQTMEALAGNAVTKQTYDRDMQRIDENMDDHEDRLRDIEGAPKRIPTRTRR